MDVDVLIVGAGPAGIVSSIELAKRGLKVVVIDEYYKPGGRLLGQLYEDPNLPKENNLWDGKVIASKLTEEAVALGVTILCETTAWKIEEQFIVYITDTTVKEIHTKAIILATGAIEKALPVKGWTKVGAISVGAAQTFTNLHNVKVGSNVVFVGIDPLSISVALEMKHAGINVLGMFLPAPSMLVSEKSNPKITLETLALASNLAPNKLFRIFGKFVKGKISNLVLSMLKFNLIKINGIPIYLRKAVTEINGKRKVESVTIKKLSVKGQINRDQEKTLYVNTVCLSGGLLPLVDSSQLVNCEMVDIPKLGGIVPLHNQFLKTTIDGVYVAGNITGIEGAKVAMAQGKLAALSLLYDLQLVEQDEVIEAFESVEVARIESPLQFYPEIKIGRQIMKDKWEEFQGVRGVVN
ncbi:NAD(P)/FAD-dependent oxidoreductase [Ureibacillus acetophenoni]|uniref:Thioredoxin reductase n=1 Tax=Ureibacillus acetophenoni TaxID=614649 RepID=A0A285UQF5_9BACL|nr:NAD(P)/FAD-dependent oxidoreductase [Ureibacillus acetophenoni]SOC43983.1 thioredoxin reductase [Ureibacillus acetophenoni]